MATHVENTKTDIVVGINSDANTGKGGRCKFCLKSSTYSCPRCNALYCSIDCYKCPEHAQCSEAFYKNWVMDTLKGKKISDEEKKATVEVLERAEKEAKCSGLDSDDEDEEPSIEERLAGLDLDKDTDKIWNRLTGKEKSDFESMIVDGRLGHLLDDWVPWWQHQDDLVEDLEQKKKVEHPEIAAHIPELSTLLHKTQPSDSIKCNLVNVLYSYACMMRLCNGDPFSVCLEATQDMLEVSAVISHNTVYHSPEEAAESAILALQKQRKGMSEEFYISIIKDVELITYGPKRDTTNTYIMAALSDILHLLHTVKTKGRKQTDTFYTETLKKQIFRAKKKVEFFLSWLISDRGTQAFESLLPLKMMYAQKMNDLKQYRTIEQHVRENLGELKPPPKLIQELT